MGPMPSVPRGGPGRGGPAGPAGGFSTGPKLEDGGWKVHARPHIDSDQGPRGTEIPKGSPATPGARRPAPA